MDSAQYWKIRAAALAARLAREQAERAVSDADRRLDKVIAEAGLIVGVPYRFDDEKETITATNPVE